MTMRDAVAGAQNLSGDLLNSADESRGLTIEEVEANVQRRLARHEARARVSSVVSPAILVLVVLLLWEAGTRAFGVAQFLLPPPSLILLSLFTHAKLLLGNTWITAAEIAGGFVLSILIGVPLSLAIFLWPPFSRAVFPLLVSSQAMPKVAIAPLLLVWFGFGIVPKVLIAFLIAFFPVVINTVVGLASIEREKIYLARSMGLSVGATFFKIRLPNALPSIFAGLKISITLAVVGAVVGEFVGGDSGLGYVLMVANGSMDTALLFADLVVLTLLGVIFFMLVELAERLAINQPMVARASGAVESM